MFEAERHKAKALLEYAQELEKKLEAPFDAVASGVLVPSEPAIMRLASLEPRAGCLTSTVP